MVTDDILYRRYLGGGEDSLSCGNPRSRTDDAVRHGALLRRGLLWRHDRQSVHR